MENIESVLRRVSKLLAISQDGRGDINESIAAAEMAQRIMDKYNIEHQDIIISEMKRNAEFLEEKVGNASSKMRKWVQFVAVGISRFYNVRVDLIGVPTKSGIGNQIRFRGFKNDVTLAKYVFEYLTNEIEMLANLEARKGKISGYDKTKFKEGVARMVQVRFKQKSQERDKEMVTNGRELVVTKNTLLEEKYGRQGFRNFRINTSSNAFHSGVAVGNNIDLDRRGVNYTNNQSKMLAN